MPRYFGSYVTGRPMTVGDRSFIFEPVEPMGGSWLGVLAVDDESAASILAGAETAWEISADKYDALKKKRTGVETVHGFVPSQTPQLPRQPLEVAASPADRPSGSASSGGIAGAVATAIPATASVSLLTTTTQPPREPILEVGAPKRRKAA